MNAPDRSTNAPRSWRPLAMLCVAVLLFCSTGATCPQFVRQYTSPLPRVLPDHPTLEQVIEVVNANSAKIRSLSASNATLSVPGIPALRANLACEPPRRFRLRADTMITGPALDVGSNDELFWMWSQTNPQKAVFFCRHEQFAQSAARQFFPVEPQWLIEALGVVRIDPSESPSGPNALGTNRLEIRTTRQSTTGPLTKIIVVDNLSGVVVEQSLYDGRGQRLATATATNHLRDPISGAIVPQHIEINWPAANLSFKLDMYDLTVNTLPPGNAQLWTMPSYQGMPLVDLADPNLQMTSPGTYMPQAGPVTGLTPAAVAPGPVMEQAPLSPSLPQGAAMPPQSVPAAPTAGDPWNASQAPPQAPATAAPARLSTVR